MKLTPKLTGTLILLLGLSGTVQASQPAETRPNYQFEQLVSVNSVNNFRVNGWAPINKQTLIMSAGPNRKYLVVLQRPDSNLVFSNQLAVTNTAGKIMTRFDKVYAMNTGIKVGIPIRYIYELKGKEQEDLARQLVSKADEQAKQAKEAQKAKSI